MRQHRQANKVMLKRDLHARKTEEENAMLRAKLHEMSSARPVSARPGSDRSVRLMVFIVGLGDLHARKTEEAERQLNEGI
ncbi:hypothetical protein AK812_SmicGene45031, partial [Symbiodinium microadriaticum]